MTPAEQLVEALTSRRALNRDTAIHMVRKALAGGLYDAAGRFDRSHIGLLSTARVVEQLHQDADAIVHGDPLRGAAA